MKFKDLLSGYDPDKSGLGGSKEGGAWVRWPAIKGETELDFVNHIEKVV